MMTTDQAIERASAIIDQYRDEELAKLRDLLIANGATDAEIEREMSHHAAEWAACKAKNLPNLRKWLEREGETLQ
jgi:hypothetical protein